MAFKAFGKTIRKEDYTTIRKMARIVTQDPIDIYDLRSSRMQISQDDVVFIFGHVATLEGTSKDCKAKLSFPEVEKMSTDLGETEVRQEGYETPDFVLPWNSEIDIGHQVFKRYLLTILFCRIISAFVL